MAAADVLPKPQQERSYRRKPFQWVKNLANLKHKGGDQQEKNNGKKNSKKSQGQNGTSNKNNPYPESGHLHQRRQSQSSSADGHLAVGTPTSRPHPDTGSYDSLPNSTTQDREAQSTGTRSGAPTLATKAETVHSDAGHSKAATTTTYGGALSSIDGVGVDSTFSSPNHSQHSLTTTLTTIQSTGAGSNAQGASGHPNPHHHGSLNNPNPNPVMFSHQYPVSPAPSTTNTISAIPRHITEAMPNTYNSATANGLLTDNASIMTLASSSKRRRRSMDSDTGASVRALAPRSVFGGSRESLPLSVLSGNADTDRFHSTSRPSIGGIASAERASVYSAQGPGMASERNSYYSYKPGRDLGDAKSLRSITNTDARSTHADAKSMGDVGSLRESSIRSGTAGHGRNDSVPGSSGARLPTAISRRSSDWQKLDGEDNDDEMEDARRPSLEEHEHN